MTRSRSLVFACLAAACLAATAIVTHVAESAVSVFRTLREVVHTFAAHVLCVVAPEPVTLALPAVRQVQAKAFKARIEKRERPVVTNSWRMCPST